MGNPFHSPTAETKLEQQRTVLKRRLVAKKNGNGCVGSHRKLPATLQTGKAKALAMSRHAELVRARAAHDASTQLTDSSHG